MKRDRSYQVGVASHKARKYNERYTLIQHTGYSVFGRVRMSRTVEVAPISGAISRRVIAAGGQVFDTEEEAKRAAYRLNYPKGPTGMLPKVNGKFDLVSGLDLPVYITMEEECLNG